MGGHGDERPFVRRRGFDDHLFRLALLHRAFYAVRKCRSNFSKVLFTPSYAICNHGVKVTGSVSGDMGCQFDNIDYSQQLYGKLQCPRYKASVRQNFFSRLRSVQWNKHSTIHCFLPVDAEPVLVYVLLVHLDFNFLFFRFFGLRQSHFQDAVFKRRLNPVSMNISRQLKGPHERSIGALRPVIVFLLNLFFFFLFPFDGQRMIRKIDLNIVFINSRKLSLNYDVAFLFVKIHWRTRWLHPLGSKPSFWPPRSHPPSKKFFHHPFHVSLPPRKSHKWPSWCNRFGFVLFYFLRHCSSPPSL